jgi:hypothetical protein
MAGGGRAERGRPALPADGRQLRHLGGLQGGAGPGVQGHRAAERLHRAAAACVAPEGQGGRHLSLCLRHHAARDGRVDRHVRRAPHGAHRVSARGRGRRAVRRGPQLPRAAARAGADRRGLRAGLPGVHGVHRAALRCLALHGHVGAGDEHGRPGHRVHGHAAGAADRSRLVARGLCGAGRCRGAVVARHLLARARACPRRSR